MYIYLYAHFVIYIYILYTTCGKWWMLIYIVYLVYVQAFVYAPMYENGL